LKRAQLNDSENRFWTFQRYPVLETLMRRCIVSSERRGTVRDLTKNYVNATYNHCTSHLTTNRHIIQLNLVVIKQTPEQGKKVAVGSN